MRARFVRSSSTLLLLMAGVLIAVSALSPSAVQATHTGHAPPQLVRWGAATPSPTTAPAGVAPGPTTAPPLLALGGSSTATCVSITAGQLVKVVLTLVNRSSQNTPTDAMLVVNLPPYIANLAVTSSFGGSPSSTINGFMLPVALAAGQSGQVAITFNVGAFQAGTLDLTASVSEVGGSGEVLSNVFFTRVPPAPCALPTSGPTYTPVSVVPSTPVVPSLARTPTSVPPTATAVPPSPTSTSIPAAAAVPSSATPVVPPSMTPVVAAMAVPSSATPVVPPSMTPVVPPSMTPVVPPSMTPVVPPSMTPVVSTKTVTRHRTVTRYRTVTRQHTLTRYRTVPRYQTVKRYQTITRYATLVRYKTLYRTVVRYKTVVQRRQIQAVHVIVHHKMVIRHVTRIRQITMVKHRTIVKVVYAVRVLRHPKTGRFADLPAHQARGPMPKPDAYMSVPRLGITYAPVWTRGYVDDGYGGITYDIVPYYGVTRFAYSVPFGVPGLTMVYGHDDIYGSIFRYLANLRRGDAIQVARGQHRFTYVVRSVSIVSPTDVSMLTMPRDRPTLALISCTPWWVDTQRVVVIAQMQ